MSTTRQQQRAVSDLPARFGRRSTQGSVGGRQARMMMPTLLDEDDLAAQVAAAAEQRRRSSMRWRLRAQLRPWYAALAVFAIAVLVWVVNWATGHAHTVFLAGGTTGTGLTLVVFVAAFARGSIPARWRARVFTAGVTASVWAGLAVHRGPSWQVLAALVVATVALSARWWRHHRLGYPTGPIVDEPDELDSIPARFGRYVGSNTGPLPGAWLSDRAETKAGEQYTLNLVPGRQTLRSALGVLDKISSGLNSPAGDLVLEEHPSEAPTQLLLTVVHRSPVKHTAAYTGPELDHPGGEVRIRVGPYADGDGHATWRLWTPGDEPHAGSWWGGLIIGGMGAGKSRLVEEIAIGAAATGHTVTWFIDPQGGASSPALARHADWYVDGDNAAHMLTAAENLVGWRAKENASNGWIGFDPAPDRPGVVIFIDEAHEVFAANTERWTTLGRKCRKVGVSLVALSQYPGLTTFGKSEPLRAAVMAGNGIIMRAESRMNNQLMPGVEVDPLTLPNLPGYGYTLARGQGARLAPFRAFYVTNPQDWLAAHPQAPLDPVAAHAAGPTYTQRKHKAEADRAQLRAQLDAITSGTAPPMPTAAAGPVQPVERDEATHSVWPRLDLAADADDAGDQGDPAATATRLPPLTGAQARVWDALAPGGEHRFKDLLQATGWSKARLHTVITELVENGQVTKAGHGRYRRTQ